MVAYVIHAHGMWMTSTKTISLDEQAYNLLRKAKRPGESFSDVVKRIARPRPSLASFAGAWKDMPPETRKSIQRFRAEARRLDEEKRSLAPKRGG
jgi:predicted CopG family antitoxin